MKPQELALLVEFSEARAYASLIQGAPRPFLEDNGLHAIAIGSAVAIVAQTVTNSLNMNRVIGLGVAETATQEMVEEIADLYATRGLSFGVEVSPHARPKELADWLRSRRIRRGVSTAVHYRFASATQVSNDRISVARAPRESRQTVADICCSVFQMPYPARTLIANTADNPEWRQWLAFHGDQPVAAALSFVRDGVAWIGWDATLPEFRGRGAQAALIAHRVTDAAAAGCTFVTTETAVNTGARSDPSFLNYQRAGFTLAYERATYVALPARR